MVASRTNVARWLVARAGVRVAEAQREPVEVGDGRAADRDQRDRRGALRGGEAGGRRRPHVRYPMPGATKVNAADDEQQERGEDQQVPDVDDVGQPGAAMPSRKMMSRMT